LRGASAIEKLVDEHKDPGIRVLVIWEPVLPTDVLAPSTLTLKRISDARVSQYWDKERLLSQAMGERDRRTIVWDYIGIYEPGTVWQAAPPKAMFEGRPVVQVIAGARTALERASSVHSSTSLRNLSSASSHCFEISSR
jgi:hypothetical protein